MLLDKLNRPLRDLRSSVTDRRNFRCVYCMPKEVFSGDFQFHEHDSAAVLSLPRQVALQPGMSSLVQ